MGRWRGHGPAGTSFGSVSGEVGRRPAQARPEGRVRGGRVAGETGRVRDARTGTRNHAVFTAAVHLGELAAAGLLEEATVTAELLAASQATSASTASPPLKPPARSATGCATAAAGPTSPPTAASLRPYQPTTPDPPATAAATADEAAGPRNPARALPTPGRRPSLPRWGSGVVIDSRRWAATSVRWVPPSSQHATPLSLRRQCPRRARRRRPPRRSGFRAAQGGRRPVAAVAAYSAGQNWISHSSSPGRSLALSWAGWSAGRPRQKSRTV